jgi:glycosyltransferase involved in cell wall biosynthesis
MKIAYIVPGSGGSFYCGNCFRDSTFLKALQQSGHDIIIVPMYLPLTTDHVNQYNVPIFYGAVNLYLKQMLPFLRRLPKFIQRFFNSSRVLRFAAHQSGSTNAAGLENMTVSMLKGEQGNQADDLQTMITWFKEHLQPDIIHLSNALLLGLAPKLKTSLNVRIVCSLQDEDEWLDEMPTASQEESYKLMAQNAAYVDQFISVSHYFSSLMQPRLNLPEQKIKVIYNGIDVQNYTSKTDAPLTHVIGYISKLNHLFGFDILVDTFIILKQKYGIANLKLLATGGLASYDKHFVHQQEQKLHFAGLSSQVEIIKDFNEEAKQRLFTEATILSVPSIRKEAFGMYLLEAFASGIPVIQPNYGAYPEIISTINGGMLYEPNDADQLAKTIHRLITNTELYTTLQHNCNQLTQHHFGIHQQVKSLIHIYESLT